MLAMLKGIAQWQSLFVFQIYPMYRLEDVTTNDVDVKDASNKTIKSHSGEFTTQSTTAVDNITTNNANIQKIMRDGQFIIVRDGVEYTIMGAEIQ